MYERGVVSVRDRPGRGRESGRMLDRDAQASGVHVVQLLTEAEMYPRFFAREPRPIKLVGHPGFEPKP